MSNLKNCLCQILIFKFQFCEIQLCQSFIQTLFINIWQTFPLICNSTNCYDTLFEILDWLKENFWNYKKNFFFFFVKSIKFKNKSFSQFSEIDWRRILFVSRAKLCAKLLSVGSGSVLLQDRRRRRRRRSGRRC